jgi:hypothetical protein
MEYMYSQIKPKCCLYGATDNQNVILHFWRAVRSPTGRPETIHVLVIQRFTPPHPDSILTAATELTEADLPSQASPPGVGVVRALLNHLALGYPSPWTATNTTWTRN